MSGRAALGLLGLLLSAPASGESLRVFAAASLGEAFRDVAMAFEAAHRGAEVELSFAGSQVLRTQIEQGASADVFASADTIHAAALHAAGQLAAPRVFAANRLVVVVPGDSGRVQTLADLGRSGVKVVMAGPTVPAGRYAGEVLRRLDAAAGYGPAFGERVRANVVSEETNVRVVLAKVALGEADAGFVYASDAAASDRVRVIEIPPPANVVAEYAIGVVARSASPDLARAFVGFVLGGEGRAILARHGLAR